MSYRITIEPLGQTVEAAAGQTTLDACPHAGMCLPHACCHGLCANFSYVRALNEPTESCDWNGLKGFVHEAAADRFKNDFRGHRAYLCGPPLMIEACIRTSMQGRQFERDIFTGKFLTSADGANAAARSPLFKSI